MKYVVVSGMLKKSYTDQLALGREINLKMTGNANFPSPIPTLPTFATIINNAEAAYLQAKTGGPDATANMRVKVAAFALAVKQLVTYVEVIANQNPANAEAVILSAGMLVKGRPTRTIKNFDAWATKVPGEIKLKIKAVKGAAYEFQISYDITNPANWKTIVQGTLSSATLQGQPVNTQLHFRGRVIIKNQPGEWSEVRTVYLLA
ncbi:MAG: hypothetical protein JSS79_20760 [Bacteroidetes bacterium]|nr:hypothetical protein [Bacteroidota bacterium]